ncbi:unnamed protein product [Linum tenue]|uniref:Uncharacterized protein n=1 Tax=Linum tenue TaxID=586396 RepID=A0AAV0N3V6_9ROSI|nr:unnamed protein product [Linum tenue]
MLSNLATSVSFNDSAHLSRSIDRVAKSSLYKEYIDGVISEATLALLPEIIEGRKGEVNKIIRRRRVSSSPPNYDNEWDVLLAAMNDVTVDIDAITRQKEQLKHAVVRQMAADLPYPPPG